MRVESEVNPTNDEKELSSSHKVVTVFSQIGYTYEVAATHLDERPNLHFRRKLGRKNYPHYHLIYDFSISTFSIHIDRRKHVSSSIEANIGTELERIHTTILNIPHSIDIESREISRGIARHALNIALFGRSDEEHRIMQEETHFRYAGRHARKQPLKKEARRKYLRMRDFDHEVEFGGVVRDWVPVAEEFPNLDRHSDNHNIE